MHNDRKSRMLSSDVVSTGDDAAARDVVFTLGAPRVVIIKINSKDKLGLAEATATKEQVQQKIANHREVAAKLGIDGDAFRDRAGLVHNGKRVYEHKSRVRLHRLIGELQAAGYKLTNACWFQKPAQLGKRQPDPTVQFTFALAGEAIEMSERITTFFQDVYVDGFHLWCNPKMDGETPYRLDTLNGFAGDRPKNAAASPGYVLSYATPTAGTSGYDLE